MRRCFRSSRQPNTRSPWSSAAASASRACAPSASPASRHCSARSSSAAMVTSAVPWCCAISSAAACCSAASAGGAQVAQHPAREVHRAAREAGHLPPLHLLGVARERGQGLGRAAGQGVRVPGEQQRMQRGRGVLHPHVPAGRRAQQRQGLGHPALVGPEHPQPRGGGHPVRALGERERLTEQLLGLGQVTRGVVGPAADRQAPGPGHRIRRGQRSVLGELGGLPEAAAEVGRPRSDLQRGRARHPGALDIFQGLRIAAPAGADPGPRQPAFLIGVQEQGVIQQGLGRGVVEALPGPAPTRPAARARPARDLRPAARGGPPSSGRRPAAGPGPGPPAGAAAPPVRRWRSPPGPPAAARAGTGGSRPRRPGTARPTARSASSSSSTAPRPSTAASRSMSSSGPITAAVRSSAPALPSSSQRADTDSTSDAGSVPPAACWASSVRNSGCPLDRSYSSSHPGRADQLRGRVPAEHAEVDEPGGRQGLARSRPDRGHHGQRLRSRAGRSAASPAARGPPDAHRRSPPPAAPAR